MLFNRILAVFAAMAILAANATQAQTNLAADQKQPSKCWLRLGVKEHASALVLFESPTTVQLFFDRDDGRHYDSAAAGQDFWQTTRTMRYAGRRPLTSDGLGRYSFDQGAVYKGTIMKYELEVKDNVVTGMIRNSSRGDFPLLGGCI